MNRTLSLANGVIQKILLKNKRAKKENQTTKRLKKKKQKWNGQCQASQASKRHKHTHFIYFKNETISTLSDWVIFYALVFCFFFFFKHKNASFIVSNFSPLGVFVFSCVLSCVVVFYSTKNVVFHFLWNSMFFSLASLHVCVIYGCSYGASSKSVYINRKKISFIFTQNGTDMKQGGQKPIE